MNKNKDKKWGHPLNRLAIGDSNSTSVYDNSNQLTIMFIAHFIIDVIIYPCWDLS